MIINPYIYGVATSYDPDAQLFFDAQTTAGVTLTTTEKDAVNEWVIDSKAAGIWTKFNAIYPIVGGTATSHKFNLKNPLDTDAAFRLVFAGGVTHSSDGVLFNGTNGWANTFLNMSIEYSNAYDVHLSDNIYTDFVGTLAQGHIGANVNGSSTNRLGATSATIENSYLGTGVSGRIQSTVTPTTHKGFWCGSRLSATNNNLIDPTGTITTNTASISSALPTISIGLGCRRSSINDQYSGFGYSFFSAGDGLTPTEMTNFKTAVNNFQTTLGRI